MYNKTASNNLQREATIREFRQAYGSGNLALASRIEEANSGPNLERDWNPIDFEQLRAEHDYPVETLPD